MTKNQRSTLAKSFNRNSSLAFEEFVASFKVWRIFYLIGFSDIRKRYSRSRLGQFWLVLPLAVNICSLGFVWAYLFKIPVKEYLPFIATGMILWNFIAACLVEGASLYINSTHYLKELAIPKLAYVNSLLMRNLIVLAHNLPILGPIYLFAQQSFSPWQLAGFVLSLLTLIIFLYGIVTITAIISLRFRDFPNVVASCLQILFYLTPVMWKIELLPIKFQKLLIFNPFCVFLSLTKAYLLASNIPNNYWLAGVIYAAFSLILASYFFSKLKARIIYWA